MMRFEEQLRIELSCLRPRCRGALMKLKGNLSLREAGADCTRLLYECPTCSRRVTVADGAPRPSAAQLDAFDTVE